MKRGVVAQAITHLANGGLDQSIQFLLITFPLDKTQYENRNLRERFMTSSELPKSCLLRTPYG